MPELQWDAFDFFYCLEVEPEIEAHGISYFYEVQKESLILLLTVRPLESLIEISLRHAQSNEYLVSFALFVHGKIRHINDKRGDYLEFADCIMAPHRFAHLEADKIWGKVQPNWTVELSIKPRIQIRYRD